MMPLLVIILSQSHNRVILSVGLALKGANELCSLEHCMTPRELQEILEELTASRPSQRRAWENLQEIRWVVKDTAGVELPSPERKTIDLEGRILKDGVRKTIRDRLLAFTVQSTRTHPLICQEGHSSIRLWESCLRR
jgi:hypothetical protein